MISQIDSSQFDTQVKSSPTPVIVEFFSEYCEPCQRLLVILNEIAAERPDSLRIFKFNAYDDPQFASTFRISSMPNLILFKAGVPIGQRTGFALKRELLSWIDSTLS